MRYVKYLLLCLFVAAACYGAGRLYFQLTGGFTIGNITNEALAYDPRWEMPPMTPQESAEVLRVLDQDYYYLGKGCQSYVFASQDGRTVLKFPKYQRFRPQAWINLCTWMPGVSAYQQKKGEFRLLQMEKMFRGWTLGFEELSEESGVIFIHLNKTPEWSHRIVLHDKMGMTHAINLGTKEFMLQKRAVMLDQEIERLMSQGNVQGVEVIIDRILAMIMGEYYRGLADNDHALVQNTGVIDGRPIHIDVGQFIRHREVKSPDKYGKELFNKTYRMHQWLEKKYPPLADHVKSRLVTILGPDYYYFPPYVYRPNFDKLPDDEFGPTSL